MHDRFVNNCIPSPHDLYTTLYKMEHVPSLEELVRMTPPTLEEVAEVERIMLEREKLNEDDINDNIPIKHANIVELTHMVRSQASLQRAASQEPSSTSAKVNIYIYIYTTLTHHSLG